MSQPIIEIRGLSKRYQLGAIGATSVREEAARLWSRVRGTHREPNKEFWALRDISFDIQPGEVVGVIGRNGAGKSTLLKILSRITEPTSGSVRMRGRVASLLEVGTGFHPELSGRENIYLNGAILGMTRAEVRRKFDEIVAFSEVERFIDTPVKRYSSGMYVRLAFAVAAHLEPEILIVDEVLAVGDVTFQKKCLGKLSDITRTDGRTVFFVSHNMNAVRTLCSRTVWLDGGRLRMIDTTESCLAQYLAPSREDRKAEIDDLTFGTNRMGDGRARIRRLRLSGEDGNLRTEFTMGEGFWVEATIDAGQPMSSYLIGFHIATTDQQIVFSSNHHDSLPTQVLQAGRHVFRCHFHGVTLAPGEYTITYAISAPVGGVCHDLLADALHFSIEPIIHTVTPGTAHYLDGRPGLIRSTLHWEKLPATT